MHRKDVSLAQVFAVVTMKQILSVVLNTSEFSNLGFCSSVARMLDNLEIPKSVIKFKFTYNSPEHRLPFSYPRYDEAVLQSCKEHFPRNETTERKSVR